ncbi:MAG: 4Fe-4S binding protein [Candidatus Lokiarchaeota archaeon]|nr:4Fe-4S binding protein [Candidatus Lokiarchaeota archaeon]
MEEKEAKVRELFVKMLEDAAKYAVEYEFYEEDMKDYHEIVQWKFGSIRGYQIFDETEYSFKIDEEAEDPTLTLGTPDLDLAYQFLNDEFDHWPAFTGSKFLVGMKGPNGKYKEKRIGKLTGFAPGSAPKTSSSKENAPPKQRRVSARLVRIPVFRPIMERTSDPENSNTVRIPINESLGTYENESIPLAVLEYFINKASHVYVFQQCPCRALADCKNYDQSLGCLALGNGVLRMKTFGRIGTKEEALERSRKAVAAGLLPSLGRVKGDTIVYHALPEQGDLMHICFCCPCCCVEAFGKDSPMYLKGKYPKMEGTNITINEDLCDGCEKEEIPLCLEVCIYGGMEVIDGVAVNDREGKNRCKACGRCERVCPKGAITITIEEDSVKRMIARIETSVDVSENFIKR